MSVIRLESVATYCLLALCSTLAVNAGAQSPEDAQAKIILEKADEIRFPRTGFQVDINVNSTQDGQPSDARKYRVLSKGNANTVVMVTEPASDRGQIILMKDNDLWVFLPDVSQPVRLSLSQRLTGQVANGDLARANFAGDYTPKLLRSESIDGQSFHVLELIAAAKGVTYHRVLYWVNQANNRPYKAEFYSVSNRLLKTARYENYQSMLGTTRPTRLVFQDALRKGEQSVLEYSDMKARELPDRVFTKEYLRRLE
ncbi:MAG: outer membrane lipoprotein-sorting protein [Burkholderiales bacterium]|nr:outer membrane lipoprotein-sorting protein [Burkholderiales bacterium]